MTLHIGAREARNQFSALMGQVHYGGKTIIVEKSGKPMAAMIPVEMFEKIIAEREARFEVLDRIYQHLPETTEEERQLDVAEAVAAARASLAGERG